MTRNNKHDKRFKSNKIIQMTDWKAEEMKSHIDKLKLEKMYYTIMSQKIEKKKSSA